MDMSMGWRMRVHGYNPEGPSPDGPGWLSILRASRIHRDAHGPSIFFINDARGNWCPGARRGPKGALERSGGAALCSAQA